MNPYTKANWVKFREDVIKLDGDKCVRCFRSRSDGATLQVHHKLYFRDLKPWEYSYEDCETLCKGCHAAEHGIIVPRQGWECVGHNDLDDLIGTCELCSTKIRHQYFIVHPKWPPMEVGTDCCDHLTGTFEASEYVDGYKKYQAAIKRFASSSRWKKTENGNLKIKQDGIRVFITSTSDGFKIFMEGLEGKNTYSSILDAKVHAFKTIASGKADQFLDHVRQKNSHKHLSAHPRGRGDPGLK